MGPGGETFPALCFGVSGALKRAMPTIRPALFPADSAEVLAIWREDVASLDRDLAFQNNEAEFANLPGKYAAPQGRLLLGLIGPRVMGCIALRPVSATICEMKRLYVRPQARGTGLGRRLAVQLITEARATGYTDMRLDVLEEFAQARSLYASLGFQPAEPVTFNPVPGTSFLGLALA